jgi:NADPH:quinone reductase-like Zn-dependent oxidoreductase
MKAERIYGFGSPDVIVIDDVPTPTPNDGEVVVRVVGAGDGPWDALILSRARELGLLQGKRPHRERRCQDEAGINVFIIT